MYIYVCIQAKEMVDRVGKNGLNARARLRKVPHTRIYRTILLLSRPRLVRIWNNIHEDVRI